MLLSTKQSTQSKIKSATSHRREAIVATSALKKVISESVPEKLSERNSPWSVNSSMGSQRVTFANKSVNRNSAPVNNSTDPITPHHRDNVTLLSEEWEKVKADLSRNGSETSEYVERIPNQRLQNFQPFDLEEYWGQRQLRNIP